MKKQLFTALGLFCLITSTIAQEEKPANLRHPCNTFEAMEEGFKANPALRAQFEASQVQFEADYQQALQKQKTSKTAATTYTIPIVFHVMGPLNITDQVFENLVGYFNRDYAQEGSDTNTINSAFKNLLMDTDIRFALAKRDPNGNCTNGIIRHNSDNIYWSQSSPAYNYSGTGTNRWPVNKYLNIYIVECISSATYSCPVTTGAYIGGYTYLPGSTPYTSNGNMGDAIVLLRNQLAQVDPMDSRTISHEIGHWLNLYHTFGSSNNPSFTSSSSSGPSSCSSDQVSDTPPTGGYFSFCPSAATYTRDCSSPPNYENIMDYASCPKMFTAGQVTRMRTALTSGTGGRNNLWTAANYLATGIDPGYTCTPVADFTANKVKNCAGNTFTFTSTSQTGSTGGTLSWSFPGGTPSVSSATQQAVTYSAPGTYTVTLVATNPNGTDTETKTSYITVVNGAGGQTVPYLIDFEGTGLPSNVTVVNNNGGSVTWVQNTATGGNSTAKSIYINGASSSSTAGHIDWFETPTYDFTSTSGISMSWYYAYAKKVAAQVDSIKVQYSIDCGGSWSNVLGVPTANTMATASGGTQSTSFVPTAAQWKQTVISSALLTAIANKPSVKFRFYFRSDATHSGSNNIYIDQINITGNIATSISDLEKSLGLLVYPNPTNGGATIDMNLADNETVKISVVDLVGRVLEETTKTATNAGNVTYTVNKNGSFAKGVYIINVDVNNQRVSKKLIIE